MVNETDEPVLVRFSVIEDSGEVFRQLIRLKPKHSTERLFREGASPERWVVTDDDGVVLLTIVMDWDEVATLDGAFVIR